MNARGQQRGWVRRLAVHLLTFAVSGAPILSADDGRLDFHIPAQPLESALLAFSEQAGLQVLAASTVTRHRRSQSVRGRYAPTEALVLLLGSEALRFRYVSANTVAISAAGQRGNGRQPGADPDPDAGDPEAGRR